MVEELEEAVEDSLPQTEEPEESKDIVEEVGRIVEKIERERPTEEEEEEEVTEYGIVIYKVEPDLLKAMLLQADLYNKVLEGQISITEAVALAEKELAAVSAKIEQDLIRKSDKSKKKKSRKTRASKASKTKKKSKS